MPGNGRQRKDDRERMTGRFTGAGVGPGDPGLLTLSAVSLIRECDVLALPVSDRNFTEPALAWKEPEETDSRGLNGYLAGCAAYQTALQAVPEISSKPKIFLPMPMIKDRETLKEIHDKGAEFVAGVLEQGKDVVFLTLGDPTLYSTCMYIHKRLKKKGFSTALAAGVPSFCAAAARMDMALAENREELHILPASYDIEAGLALKGTKVLMKAGRNMAEVKRLLTGQELDVGMVENCGMDRERVFFSAEEIPEDAGYYSLVVAKERKKKGAGS